MPHTLEQVVEIAKEAEKLWNKAVETRDLRNGRGGGSTDKNIWLGDGDVPPEITDSNRHLFLSATEYMPYISTAIGIIDCPFLLKRFAELNGGPGCEGVVDKLVGLVGILLPLVGVVDDDS